MSPEKQVKVDNVRASLEKHGIEFAEKANGHFKVYKDGEPIVDLWATTEKFKEPIGNTGVGLHLAAKIILTAYGRI